MTKFFHSSLTTKCWPHQQHFTLPTVLLWKSNTHSWSNFQTQMVSSHTHMFHVKESQSTQWNETERITTDLLCKPNWIKKLCLIIVTVQLNNCYKNWKSTLTDLVYGHFYHQYLVISSKKQHNSMEKKGVWQRQFSLPPLKSSILFFSKSERLLDNKMDKLSTTTSVKFRSEFQDSCVITHMR